MTLDIFDAGEHGDFPHMPRHEDGTVDRSRVDLGPPMPHIRINGVLTPLGTIVDALDEHARSTQEP